MSAKLKIILAFTFIVSLFTLIQINSFSEIKKGTIPDEKPFRQTEKVTEEDANEIYNIFSGDTASMQEVEKVLQATGSKCQPVNYKRQVNVKGEKNLVGQMTLLNPKPQNITDIVAQGRIDIPADGLFKLETPDLQTSRGVVVALYLKCSNSEDIYGIVPYTDSYLRTQGAISTPDAGIILGEHLNILSGIIAITGDNKAYSSSNDNAELVFRIKENTVSARMNLKQGIFYPVTKGSYVLLFTNKWFQNQLATDMFQGSLIPFEK